MSSRVGVRPDIRAVRVSSAAPKKKSFDRCGPVWPPRSNVANDRLGGGVWGGFASEVYPPPATRSSTSRCKIFQASKGKQPQAKASKSKPKEAKASKSQLEFKFKISSTLDCAWQKQAGSSVELILNFNSSWLLLALASFGLLLLAFACFGLLWLL